MFEGEDGYLLRIFISESDSKDNMPLYEWIVREAQHFGMSGATVLRGIEGFGSQKEIHTAKILQLSTYLPIIIEIIDSDEKITSFMPRLEGVLEGGLITQEKIKLRIFRHAMAD